MPIKQSVKMSHTAKYRCQVGFSLTEAQDKQLGMYASLHGISKAQVLRDSLDLFLALNDWFSQLNNRKQADTLD